jgi:hypothetical protein
MIKVVLKISKGYIKIKVDNLQAESLASLFTDDTQYRYFSSMTIKHQNDQGHQKDLL